MFLEDECTIYIGDLDQLSGTLTVLFNGTTHSIALFDETEIQQFLAGHNSRFLLDITNIPLAIWAPIIRACILGDIKIDIEYSAPTYYWDVLPLNDKEQEVKSKISTRIEPIHGFGPIFSSEMPQIFVPILGFQGSRALYLYNAIESKPAYTFPIITLPGIRPLHYQDALISNRIFLMRDSIYRQIKHVYVFGYSDTLAYLQNLSTRFPQCKIRIGLLGPRIQCLAAVVCASKLPEKFELIYDHPETHTTREIVKRKKFQIKFEALNEN
ncbi:hypothetical protein [Deinococcus marmoris]|uniref:hypothetical protein n=1 Tax=Deinococcus marmoris TaxID=249408 RepID=UPI0011150857|nr:hypothetical protein [Deinococcus marmoris]